MRLKGKKIFITGGAGFIGTHLIKKMIRDNKIVVYDNLRRNALGHTDLINHSHLKLIKGDVLDQKKLTKVVKGANANIVIHMSAIAGVDTVIKSPTTTMKVNIIGTYNILKAINGLNQLERFLNFSTSEVFGSYAYKSEESHSTNLQPVGETRWVYATSKLAGEHLTYSYYKEFGLPTISIRPFNIYGPGQIGEGAIHVFIKRALEGKPIQIHGKGDQIRSWCYIDDIVNAVLLCLTKKETLGEVFNIGNPKGTVTVLSLAKKIIKLSNSNSKITYVPKNYADVEIRIPSIKKARKVLGFAPKVGLDEGIKKTIEWYKKEV